MRINVELGLADPLGLSLEPCRHVGHVRGAAAQGALDGGERVGDEGRCLADQIYCWWLRAHCLQRPQLERGAFRDDRRVGRGRVRLWDSLADPEITEHPVRDREWIRAANRD